MAKGYRSYLPNQDFLLPPSLREWLAEEHLVYFVSDVVDQLDLSGMHAVFAEDTEAVAGRYPVQSVSGRQRAGLPDDLRLSQDPHRHSARIVRAGLGDGAGVWGGETGPGLSGRDEGESQRQQAQGDELRADEGEAAATEGGSEAVAGAGRGCR